MTLVARCSSLSFRYDQAASDAVSGVDLSVSEGELVILAGVNGSGKSTLLALLAGLLGPAEGSVSIFGLPMPKERRRVSGRVALLPQNPDVYILGSLVEEDLLLGLPPGDMAAKERAMGLLGELGLGGCLGRPVQTLSFGQRRKLCLASAMAGAPKLLLFDEPLSGLDFPAAKLVRGVIAKGKAQGLAQVVAAHDLDLLADLAYKLVLMSCGRAEIQGAAEAVFPRMLEIGVRPPFWWPDGRRPGFLDEGPEG